MRDSVVFRHPNFDEFYITVKVMKTPSGDKVVVTICDDRDEVISEVSFDRRETSMPNWMVRW